MITFDRKENKPIIGADLALVYLFFCFFINLKKSQQVLEISSGFGNLANSFPKNGNYIAKKKTAIFHLLFKVDHSQMRMVWLM